MYSSHIFHQAEKKKTIFEKKNLGNNSFYFESIQQVFLVRSVSF